MLFRISVCCSLVLLSSAIGFAADPAPPPPQTESSFPPGMVGLFTGANCPEGWTDEPLTQGRIVVGAATEAEVGDVVGEPIVDKQPPQHEHPFAASADLTRSYMPIDNCCAALDFVVGDKAEMKGVTDSWTTNLPFYATRMCRRSVQP
ncbi:MAG: hypothetical protein GC160_29065 [Acidobacteria bacterium]|nr:hypothetical protein [Acidobacteriota bacterium]